MNLRTSLRPTDLPRSFPSNNFFNISTMRIHPSALVLLVAATGSDAFTTGSSGRSFVNVFNPPTAPTSLTTARRSLFNWDPQEGAKNDKPTTAADPNDFFVATEENATDEEEEEEQGTMDVLKATVYELKNSAQQANERAVYAKKRVEAIEDALQNAQVELKEKERLLKSGRDVWAAEKATLAARIAEFTSSLQDKDQEIEEAKRQAQEEAQARQAELQEQVDDLKLALEKANEILAEERQGAQDIKTRLLNAEDMLEFEQMEFEKEKNNLGQRIEDEKARLKQVERDFEKEQAKFQEERKELEKKIQTEADKLDKMTQQLQSEQQTFQREKLALEDKIQKQADSVARTESRWKAEKDKLLKDKADLGIIIEQEKAKLVEASNKLASELVRFQTEKAELEGEIQIEKGKLNDMVETLEREQERFLAEKATLLDRIEEEKSRIAQVETELANETQRFEREKEELQEQIAEGVRLRKLKANQMNKRFHKIREEMTSMLVATKNNARKEKRRLTEKYEAKLADKDTTIAEMQSNLDAANEEIRKTAKQLEDFKGQKQAAMADTQQMEKRFIDTVAQRNGVIYELRDNVSSLETVLKERERQIDNYETSFRQQILLSVKLTGKRIKKLPRRVRDLIMNKKGKR